MALAMYDDHDREQARVARRQRDRLQRDKLTQDQAINALLTTTSGRKFLWWLLGETGINANPFSADPHVTSFNCGQMNVGQKLLARLLEVNPDGYVRMMQEEADGRANDSRPGPEPESNTGTDPLTDGAYSGPDE